MSDQVEGIAEVRDARDRAVERASAAEQRAEAAEAQLRQMAATVAFDKAGLSDKHAELFLKANPDVEITTDAITDFANEYGLAPTETPPSSEEPRENPDAGAAAFMGAGGESTAGSAPAPVAVMSQDDFQHLLATNPELAAQAYQEGRAPRNDANVQARDLVRKGIIDH